MSMRLLGVWGGPLSRLSGTPSIVGSAWDQGLCGPPPPERIVGGLVRKRGRFREPVVEWEVPGKGRHPRK